MRPAGTLRRPDLAFRPVVNERGLYTPANGKPERASAPSLRIVAAVG
ncbi:MAG TPA: hypothetical protein VIK79_12795 [Xanthobacteraceae bacterium]